MPDKRCGLCIHYKVSLSGQDACKLLKKNIRSLDIACADYNKGVSLEGLHNDVAVKKSCAEGEC
jgi:hypothetical protein